MMNQFAIALRLLGIQRLLQGIEHEVCGHGTADPPAQDAPGVYVDHGRHAQPALPGRDVREILSANSSGCRGPQSGEAREACSGTRAVIKPRGFCRIRGQAACSSMLSALTEKA